MRICVDCGKSIEGMGLHVYVSVKDQHEMPRAADLIACIDCNNIIRADEVEEAISRTSVATAQTSTTE